MTQVMEKTAPEQLEAAQSLPILPLRGTIVYPYLVIPLMIQQADQTRLVDEALMRGSPIGLFLQKDSKKENAGPMICFG